MSVHYTELSRKFFEHFFNLATKTETVEPFYATDITALFDFTENDGVLIEVNSKDEVLSILSPLLPLKPETSHSFSAQPYNDGKTIITVNAYHVFEDEENPTIKTKTNYEITFVLTEVDAETHRFGITHQILISLN